MFVYEFFKKKMFMHKRNKEVELTEVDLLRMFKEEVSNEISVKIKNKEERKNALKETWNNLNTQFPEWKKNKILKNKNLKNIYMRSVNKVTFKMYCVIMFLM